MNIINNQPSFGAIKLSNTRRSFAMSIAKHLEDKGFYDVGVGDIYEKTSTLEEKAKLAKAIREGDLLNGDEFATLILREDENFIIGNTIAFENKILPIVQKHDPEARLNLGI